MVSIRIQIGRSQRLYRRIGRRNYQHPDQNTMRCLLARRKRMHEFDANVEAQIYATFLDDISQGHLLTLKVEDKHLESAANLITMLPNHALRTLDVLYLAIA
jgi:hypothetical protein